MKLTRRKFLCLTSAAAGLSLLPAELSELVAAVGESDHKWPGPGVETWVNSVCQLCPGGCGIRVRLLDGLPVKVLGNPDHPVNQGGLCPKGAAGLQALYDPDRIRHPMKRAAGRGEDKWEEISWDEAIGLVAEKLGSLRESGHPEGLVVIGGQYRGLMHDLWRRFLDAYGSPNYVATTLGCVASDSVLHLTQGIPGPIGYDIESTNYVLSFGVSLLEGSWSPVWQMRAVAELRQGRPGRRGKIAQVDTRFSATAAKSDAWIPIRPGTDGALALGIAHVIIRDGLYDETFVRDHTYGFEDWKDRSGQSREGFRGIVMRDYPPAVVESLTGVPESRVVRVAKEFAGARPAIAMADRGASRYSNGVYTQWAVQCLNALVGSVDRPGGTLFPAEIPFAAFEPLPRDEIAEQGRMRPRLDGAKAPDHPFLASSAIHHLPHAILSDEPYPAQVVFLYQGNPSFSLPRQVPMEGALQKVPLVVSFSPFIDESTRVADLVLPDHTFLERWQDDPTPRNVGFPVLGLRRPVREPLYDTRATSDVLFALSEALGGPVRQALPWQDTESFLKERFRGVHEAGRGMMAAAVEVPWYESFRKAEGTPLPATFNKFWDTLLERGAWWDPEYRFEDWGRTLKTPSGKFEFCSDTVQAALACSPRIQSGSAVPASRDGEGAPEGERRRQGFQPPETMKGGNEYPLVLNVFRPMVFYGGRTANMPYLMEIAGKNRQVGWESWIEIHRSTASLYGIDDRDMVWVESPLGKMKVRARVDPGTNPGIVSLPFGLGHEAGGRWAKGRGANPNKLVGITTMGVTGASAYPVTRVKIYRA